GFWGNFFGFTFGVGLCEELCKLFPLLWYVRQRGKFSWRTAVRWGLASGIGFGVSEGISNSSDTYNGFCGVDVYLLRFVSCVALHAVWSAAVGVSLNRHKESVKGDGEWGEY